MRFSFIRKQVMNLNKAPAASVGLVGYLPVLEVSPNIKRHLSLQRLCALSFTAVHLARTHED